MIEGIASSFVGNNSFAGLSGEFESDDSESFGDVKETNIVGDITDNGYDSVELVILMLGVVVVGEMSDDAGQ